MGTQLVNGISYLNPLIGSDLHNLVEDTFQPHNSRSYSGINLYHFPLYKDSTANLRIHETATFQFNKSSTTNNDQGENIRAHAVAKSRYVYTAFAAWNQVLSNCRQGHVGSTSSFDLTTSLQETLLDSYSSIAMKHLITSLLQNSQIMSCAAVVSILNYHLSTSSSNTTTWFSRSFFSLSSQPLHFTKLLKPLIKAFNLLHCEIHPGKPAQSPQNHEMLKILNSLCPEFDIRKKCEMEMFVSHSEHQSDGGCLITFPSYHNNHLISTGNIHSQDSHLLGYTSISSHGRASSQFTIPILGDGKTFTISQLLRGLATTSLITQSYDILLFVAILHCRLDIVHHLLLYLHTNTSTSTQRTIISHENNSHYQILYQFCISQNNQMTQPYSLNISQYMNSIHTPGSSSSENEQLGDSHRGEELNQHEIKFMKWLCGTKIRSIHEISDGIERFLTLYSTNQEES